MFNAVGGFVTIDNSTVSGNEADTGGGIENDGGISAVNATIAKNTVSTDGAGIMSSGSSALRNTLIAANLGAPDISGAFVSLGHNLVGNVGEHEGSEGAGIDQAIAARHRATIFEQPVVKENI